MAPATIGLWGRKDEAPDQARVDDQHGRPVGDAVSWWWVVRLGRIGAAVRSRLQTNSPRQVPEAVRCVRTGDPSGGLRAGSELRRLRGTLLFGRVRGRARS